MACPLKKHQILEVIDLTTDFVAKVLCPKFEEFGSAGGTEMIANVCATLETISEKVQNRQMRFLKKDGKWIYKELPGQRDGDDDAEDEDDDGDDKHEDKMAEEADKLIKQIIKACAEHAEDDRERNANYASVVMTMLEIAPKGAKAMMASAMMAIMAGELKL